MNGTLRLTHDALDASPLNERERWLAAAERLYDRLREGGRAQLVHAVDMLERDLGGTLWIQIPSKPAKRTLPEAGYTSDVPPGVPIR